MPFDTFYAARRLLAVRMPYLAAALYAMTPVVTPQVPIAAVDEHWRLYLNPACAHLGVDVMAGILFEEVSHLIRDHGRRMREALRDDEPHTLANVACDVEIADDLVQYFPKGEVWVAPDGRTFDWSITSPTDLGLPDGLLAEEYLELLRQKRQQQQEQEGSRGGSMGNSDDGDGGGGGGDSDECESGVGGGSGRDSDAAGDGGASRDGVGSDGGAGRRAASPEGGKDEGSGVHGKRRPWEGDGEAAPKVSSAEANALRKATAAAVAAEVRNKGTGSVPAGLIRWAQAVEVEKPVPWTELLASALRSTFSALSVKSDYSWRRPSRRSEAYSPFVLPALVGKTPHDVAVVIDTSGSMSDAEIGRALGVVKDIARQTQSSVIVIACDAAVHSVSRETYTTADRVHLVGGGGTDMGVGIARAVEERASAVVVVTDMETPWPDRPPPIPVIVVATASVKKAPSWAKVITLREVKS